MQTKITEKTTSTSVSCDGQDPELGHPKVYLEIDQEIGKITCPYCGKVFKR
jgi:uncharacterized Zn-finger protein